MFKNSLEPKHDGQSSHEQRNRTHEQESSRGDGEAQHTGKSISVRRLLSKRGARQLESTMHRSRQVFERSTSSHTLTKRPPSCSILSSTHILTATVTRLDQEHDGNWTQLRHGQVYTLKNEPDPFSSGTKISAQGKVNARDHPRIKSVKDYALHLYL